MKYSRKIGVVNFAGTYCRRRIKINFLKRISLTSLMNLILMDLGNFRTIAVIKVGPRPKIPKRFLHIYVTNNFACGYLEGHVNVKKLLK